MTRIVEHRSALPFGPVVEVHVRHDTDAETPVFATVSVSTFGASPDPEAFPHPLPTTDAFLQALAYAERVWDCLRVDRRPRRPLPAREASRARRERAMRPPPSLFYAAATPAKNRKFGHLARAACPSTSMLPSNSSD
jgi:hypothetical protein